MPLDDYLEKFATDGYRQQIADEENVMRSLPFFATALAVIIAGLAAVKNLIPAFSMHHIFPIVVWSVFVLLGLCLVTSMVFLFVAVRRRRFEYVMNEVALHNYAAQLREFYDADRNLTNAQREEAVLEDIRTEVYRQTREAANHNRHINFLRAAARAQALWFLLVAIFLALVLVAIILADTKIDGVPRGSYGQGQQSGRGSQTVKRAGLTGQHPPKAGSTANRGGQERRLDLPGNIQIKGNGEEKQMSDKPQGNTTPSKPAPPPPETVKKGPDGSVPPNKRQ